MQLQLSDRQDAVACRPGDVRAALQAALDAEGADADLSVALVDDSQMRELNRRFLDRDEVTDVLAFPYSLEPGMVQGEIVANAELAAREAAGRPHRPIDELMLYLVHGLLHLLDYDDHTPQQRERMREREQQALRAAGYEAEF
jgi:probable rRNA maturation factor